MFGFKSRGQKNFEACQVRNEPNQAPNQMAHGTYAFIQSFYGYLNASINPDLVYPREATMKCAKLGEVSLASNDTAEGAKNNLVKKIGEASCKGCRFAGMGPVEAKQYILDTKSALEAQVPAPEPMPDVITSVAVTEPNNQRPQS